MKVVRNISILFVSIISLICTETMSAQRASSLRISEVMTNNRNSIVDEYAKNSPWVEIYNSSSSTIDLKGCYLTNDPSNLKLHRIPLWSTNTKVKPRQYIVLWADGNADKGVLHLDFTLSKNKSNFLALVDADGKTIISVVSIPIIPEDYSYQASDLGNNSKKSKWIVSSNPSPMEPNENVKESNKVDNLAKMDPSGIIMTTTAVAVVFIALLTLSIVFTLIGKTIVLSSIKRKNKSIDTSKKKEEEVAIALALSQHFSYNEDHIVAISLALHQDKNIRHNDNMKLTIKRKSTQWNNKAYNMRKYLY